jgi:hypothetical protein
MDVVVPREVYLYWERGGRMIPLMSLLQDDYFYGVYSFVYFMIELLSTLSKCMINLLIYKHLCDFTARLNRNLIELIKRV